MERHNLILQHHLFKKALMLNENNEKSRVYCHHDFQHQIDVARIGYIIILENNLPILKDVIYACALLHDIGRYMEYQQSVQHEYASAELAEKILHECKYLDVEINEIIDAIKDHRSDFSGNPQSLKQVLVFSDKASRMCMNCKAEDSCKWSNEKKNKWLHY